MLYVNPAAYSFAPSSAETMDGPAREKAVLREFEQLFIRQLLKEMRKSVPEGELFPKSREQEYFEEIFDDHLAGEIARSGQFGIAKEMQEQIARAAEARKNAAARKPGDGLPLTPERTGLPMRGTAAEIELPRKKQGLPLPAPAGGLPLR